MSERCPVEAGLDVERLREALYRAGIAIPKHREPLTPEPLTPEDEDGIRATAELPGRSAADFKDPWQTVDRLLATIDAARADPTSEGPSEDWVLGWSTGHLAASEGLDVARKAASFMRVSADDIEDAIRHLRGPMDRDEAIVIGCADAVLAALRLATPPQDPSVSRKVGG